MASILKHVSKGLPVSITLALLAGINRIVRLEGAGKNDMMFPRRLYSHDSDEDDNCLEDETCRFLVGFYLLICAPLLIFWNEHQFVALDTLYNTAQRCVSDLDSPTRMSNEMDGKFTCFSGRLQGETTRLSDALFPCIEVDAALLLIREIEIYQYYQVNTKDNKKKKLKVKWFRFPQRDPRCFPGNKNGNGGNWEVLSDCHNMVETGDTLNGNPIRFGDNVVTFQASNLRIGALAMPDAFMKEFFFGEQHVHRLGELELIKESQGTTRPFELPKASNNRVNSQLQTETGFHCDGNYIYDGPVNRVGTIRMKWRFAQPQDITVAAEIVAQGRPCLPGYGSTKTHNLQRKHPNATSMRAVIQSDLQTGFSQENVPLLTTKKDPEALTTHDQWTIAPFSVRAQQWFPPYHEKFLGRLWLYSPGRLSSSQLFRRAHRASSRCLWKVRGISYVILLVGWCLVFQPVTNIFEIPIFQSLLALAFVTGAFVLSTTCCLTCTAIARITARPVQTILIIASVWVVTVEIKLKLDRG